MRKLSKTIFSVAVLALIGKLDLIKEVRADQPVHCLRGQVYGMWHFYTTEHADKVNLFQIDEVCTHKLPNKLQIIPDDHEFNFASSDTWKVKVLDKYLAEAVYCPKGGECEPTKYTGTWSPIYDQAFKIELENGLRFLANFKYTVKDDISKEPILDGPSVFQQLKSGDYNRFDTHCDHTMVGFIQTMPSIRIDEMYTMGNHRIQCFFGKQIEHYDLEKTIMMQSDNDQTKVAVITGQSPHNTQNLQVESKVMTEQTSKVEAIQREKVRSFARGHMLHSQRINAHLAHVPSDENDAVISFINKNDFGWKADVCKLQVHHQDYPEHCKQLDEEKLMLTQTGEAAPLLFGDNSPKFTQALSKAQSWGRRFGNADDIPDSDIPDSYDFTSIDGYDFTGPVRDQGPCGSCYTVSFTQVIESRLKLKYGKETPQLSAQYLMQCNYMNEGCDGGWSFFHGYMTENGHMVSEQCAPYQGKTKGIQCSQYKDCPTEAKVKQSYFIGGAYGESSEKKMMKEILHRGIVNGELNVPSMFSFYKNGILSNDHESKMDSYIGISSKNNKLAKQKISTDGKSGLNDKDLEDYGVAWMNLNHSIVIYGWGVDDKGTKFWRVRNSYGTRWGMDGDFYVRRGQNDFGIESETTAYDVLKCQHNNNTYICTEDV